MGLQPGSSAAAITRATRQTGPIRIGRSETGFMDLCVNWASPSIESVSAIEDGLGFDVLQGLYDILPETTHRIVPKSTAASRRGKSPTLSSEQSDRIYQVGKVFGLAMIIYDDEAVVREFLTRRHPMLNDRTPLDVAMDSSAGADIVVNLLGHGAYGGGA